MLGPEYGRLQKLEHGPRMLSAGFASSLGFQVGGRSYSNFPASIVRSQNVKQFEQAWNVQGKLC